MVRKPNDDKQTPVTHDCSESNSPELNPKEIVSELDDDVSLEKDDEYASGIEKFIATVLSPELLTTEGKAAVLTIWSLMAFCAIYGAS